MPYTLNPKPCGLHAWLGEVSLVSGAKADNLGILRVKGSCELYNVGRSLKVFRVVTCLQALKVAAAHLSLQLPSLS